MKKRLLSFITSASLIASAFSFGTYAAPSLVGTADSATEYFPVPQEQVQVQQTEREEALLNASGPKLVDVADSATELNTEFGTPDLLEGAYLMDDLTGEGTEQSPYLITSADDLTLMANNINNGIGTSAYYKLTNNIDLNGKEWTPIGYHDSSKGNATAFSGTFDGGNYTVSNFVITKANTDYIGFFGLVTDGTIKNLNIDNAVIDFASSSTQRLYVGVVVGRLITTEAGSLASITHCNVTNSSVKASSHGTIRAGGIAGIAISGRFENSRVLLAFLNSECDVAISTDANGNIFNSEIMNYEIPIVVAGGIVASLHALDYSRVDALNCSAVGNIYADAINTTYAQALSGGAFCDIRTVDRSVGGTMSISACHSSGTVAGVSYHYPYVIGGFAGQIYPTKNLYISDCYSNADVNGKYEEAGVYDTLDPTAGGFVGQLFFENYITKYGKTIKNCYGSGNVTDLNHTETTAKDTSFVGGFMGWATANVFENCFKFEAQRVWGSDIDYTDYGNINKLSVQDSKYVDKYTGFDMENVWQMDPEAEYFYPTLREKAGYVRFISDGNLFIYGVFDRDGKVIKPDATPEKAASVSKIYMFNYWSLSEDGESFNFGSDRIDDNTDFYAKFTALPRPYTVKFINDGEVFGKESTLNYGSPVNAPQDIPEKKDDDQYYFEFLHWSNVDGGDAFDFTDCTVIGDMTFYAVYNVIDKTAWKGEIAESFASGFGTEVLPYIITSGDELALLAKVINEQQPGYVNAYYELGANINLGKKEWIPIGRLFETPFSGHFNGKGYTISNFKLGAGQYVGIFGYILNGTVTKLGVKDFSIEFTDDTYAKENVYIGSVAGYTVSSKSTTKISEISVTEGVIEVNLKATRLYTGGITGFSRAENLGTTSITDSYVMMDISTVNLGGYSYLGGIAGELYTNSGSLSHMEHCYATGSLYTKSYNSSRAGGLAGYAFSHGKYFSPETSADDSQPDDYNPSKNDSASLADDDVDVMFSDSFAIVNVTAVSTGYTSYAGYIAAEFNVHAGMKNCIYPSNINVRLDAEKTNTKGVSLPDSYFKFSELLNDSLGFDVENVWTFIPSEKYPVLMCMYSDKPILKLMDMSIDNSDLTASLQVLFPQEHYTVIFGVYSKRGQLLGVKRVDFSNTDLATEFTVNFENVGAADYVAVSAVEKFSLKPLWTTITKNI